MRSQLLYGCLLLLATGAARGQSGNTAAPCGQEGLEPNQHKALVAEVRKLRIELLEFRIEAQAAKIPILEHQLGLIEAQRLKLAEEEQTGSQQLANIDAQLSDQTLAPAQRAEIEGVKATFATAQAEHLMMARQSLQVQGAETSTAVNFEQRRLQALKAKLNELTTGP